MILGIKTETGVNQIKNVTGWKRVDDLVFIDCDKGKLAYLFNDLVLGVASDGFKRERMKPFIKEGYSEKEMCENVGL